MKMFPKINNNVYPYYPVQETNLYDVLKPFYLMLSIFGLFPHSVKYSNTKNIFTIVPKSIYVNAMCALTVILTIGVFCVAHGKDLMASWEINSVTKNKISTVNYAFEFGAMSIVCIIVFIFAFLNRERYVTILNAMAAVIQLMAERRSSILGSLRFQINAIVIGGIGLVTILQTCVNFTSEDTTWKMIIVAMTFNLPHLLQTLSLSFYYILVMMLVYVLRSINENLIKLSTEKNTAIADYTAVKEKSDKLLVMLREMEFIYAKAHDIKCDINTAFQAPILVSTLQCFHGIVCEAYIIYNSMVSDKHDTHTLFNCFTWVVYHFLTIYFLAHSGNLLKVKAMKIAQTLHNIQTEEIKVLLEIQHFSSKVNYQNAELTVYDYFPLDSTLMSGMVATATMYLIILVQFSDQCSSA